MKIEIFEGKIFFKIAIGIIFCSFLLGCAIINKQEPFLPNEQLCIDQISKKWDVNPEVVSWARAYYPVNARMQGLNGQVGIIVTLDREGIPTHFDICYGPNPLFNKAALSAAKKCTYSPATSKGLPVPSQIIVPFLFRIYNEGT